jgi:3-oxoacyl-[acyl-carrier protein] reductase
MCGDWLTPVEPPSSSPFLNSLAQIFDMNLDLTSRTAVVCGSTQGLGLASATELALLGSHVVLMARNEAKLQQTVAALPNNGQQAHGYLVADFSDSGSVKAAIDGFVAGGGMAHILVNNTGGPAGGTALDAGPTAFAAAFNAHLVCNHLLVQALAPGMKAAGFGRIVNIISTSVKQPIPGLGVSNTIRGAVASWAKTLATELGPHGITVNNVLPGFTKTARYDALMQGRAAAQGRHFEEVDAEVAASIPAGRIGQPEEFGAAVAFLCSPAAAYINGINLPVDGGRLGCL